MAEVPETSVEVEKGNRRDQPLHRHRRHCLKKTPAAMQEGRMKLLGFLTRMKRWVVLEMQPLMIFAE